MRLDLVVRGGLVADGTDTPPRRADVGVREGRIVVLPPGEPATAADTLDAAGAVVAPGFVDVHTHSDAVGLLAPDGHELAMAAVRQGVTTEICGNCGSSLFPGLPERLPAVRRQSAATFGGDAPVAADFADFAAAYRMRGRANHLASLVGHGTLRAGVVGYDDRPATDAELATMCDLLDRSLGQGAAGLSTGLIYTPGSFGGTAEVTALARVAARHAKPYVTHLRDEMSRVEEALDEAIGIARDSGAPLHVSHHKTAGKYAWGRTETTLARLTALRAGGMDLTCDVYPYDAASTSLTAMLPPWANAGGIDALTARLADPLQRNRMAADIDRGVPGWENTVGNGGWDRISIACAPSNPTAEGRTVAELVGGRDPLDVVADLLLADHGQVTIISHSMREDDVRRVLASPLSMIGSDGVPKPGHPHPRWAGTFARVLGRYTRDLGLLPLHTAVHKMTGYPAARFGLTDRGVVRTGAHADLVVFDPDTVTDRATYAEPLLAPTGVRHVLVAGRPVVRDTTDTGVRPGTVLAT
ncbi:N-acyl-D-amino-acid deacylase family protein [Actinocatenispora rupis]|uniref:Dihydroorotase n=1 Tax=Actinocatenispora rupis TaxID=519421 RepID=A0A8J3NCJ1_9ACTN|nr:D-aminoacylase [Actinocatenispora rupis]GID10499.1 dihydroorotase [Actinocatenispora rupis]